MMIAKKKNNVWLPHKSVFSYFSHHFFFIDVLSVIELLDETLSSMTPIERPENEPDVRAYGRYTVMVSP